MYVYVYVVVVVVRLCVVVVCVCVCVGVCQALFALCLSVSHMYTRTLMHTEYNKQNKIHYKQNKIHKHTDAHRDDRPH